MNHPIDQLHTLAYQAFEQLGWREHLPDEGLLKPTQNPKFGDFQINAAMALAGKLKCKPREIAQSIVEAVDWSALCDKVEIAGPGFINLTLSAELLGQWLRSIYDQERLGVQPVDQPQRVVVDYSSPNVAKQMHVGHLRSTVIGDAIARLLEWLGHDIVRQNHIGDWGTQFGMLIELIIQQGHPLAKDPTADVGLGDLTSLYQQAKLRFDEDAVFQAAARQRVVALQKGEPQTYSIWQALVQCSQQHFQQIYEMLDISLTRDDVRGESAYNDELPKVIKALEQQGMLRESQGAQCVFLDGFTGQEDEPLPLIVRKSDGGFLYATTDLAALRYRVDQLKADRLIYVTDARQQQHFSMVFAAGREAGFAAEEVRLDHVPFGMVLGEDRKPFKTREGGTIELAALLREAQQRAMAIVQERSQNLDEADQQAVARAVGTGAIKYADMVNDRLRDYVFNWDRMLAMDGNTAPYLQYAYTRIASIERKAAEQGVAVDATKTIAIEDERERQLLIGLMQFKLTLTSVADSLEPHRLCGYLYELASLFNGFYEDCPVIGADQPEERSRRLMLCRTTAATLKLGLELLGIRVLQRM